MAVLLTVAAACEMSSGSGSQSSLWGARGSISQSITSGTTSTVKEGQASARPGETIEVTYDVTVETGWVQLDVWRPLNLRGKPRLLESVTLRESRRGTMTVVVQEHLSYDIRIRPYRFRGKYDVSWKVR
jgi:hypothetical protein